MDEFCRRWKVAELAVQGAKRRSEDSELGLYVRFDPEAQWSLTDRIRMERELQSLSGKSVSLLSRHGDNVRRGRANGMRLIYDA
jgi:predicted nucleotidyltransferase